VVELGADPDALAEVLERALPLLNRWACSGEDSVISRPFKEMIEAAIELSRLDSLRKVDSGHLLLAMLARDEEPTALLLTRAGLDISAVAAWLARQRREGRPPTR
jgi:ATP-dependent Clp protease ATP-binding subunit ClpA